MRRLIIISVLLVASCTNNRIPIIDMITVPGGSFIIGSTTGDLDEQPLTEIYVNSFKISRFEVSQRLYKAVMNYNPSYHKGNDYPVESVSWQDALLFIEKLNRITGRNYRLPSEAEWEYVAKKCEELPDYEFWYLDNSFGKSHRVGSSSLGPLGIYDLIGNVNEWCSSLYNGCDYSGKIVTPLDSLVTYAVFRGGGFNAPLDYCRVENRNYVPSDTKNYAIGFRLVED